MNRFEQEYNVKQAIQPLHIESSSKNASFESQHDDGHNKKNNPDDPNILCEQLKLLLSSQLVGNENHMHKISSILAKLRDQEIVL